MPVLLRRRRLLETFATAGAASLAACADRIGDVGSRRAAIHVPTTAAVTDRLDVEVTGLRPEPVTVEAQTTDGAGQPWFGRVVVEPSGGRVVLREAEPRRGTYREPDGMGLFWSMQPERLDRLRYDADQRSQSVRLRVLGTDASESPLAETTVERRIAAPASAETSVTEPIVGTLVGPPTGGRAPGVVLFHGSSGTRPLPQARVLAARGFTVLALQYFSPDHPRLPDALVEVPVEYADRAVEWLAAHEATTDDPVGVGGFSRGGELALLVGTRNDVRCVVNWVGAGLLFNAVVLDDDLTVSDRSPDTSAWTVDGEPLPHPSREAFERWRNLTEAYQAWLDRTPAATLAGAEIPLERIDAPMLFISAGDDGVWPSRYLLSRAVDRLDAAGGGHRVEHLTYDGAGHDIGVPYLPTWPNRPGGPFGGTLAGTAAAEATSWPRAVEQFARGVDR